MHRKVVNTFRFICICLFVLNTAQAQQIPDAKDTFFLAKKKGLLGKFGKSISSFSPDIEPVKVENQFLKYKGKIIRFIDFVRLGFDQNIYDTCQVEKSFWISLAKRFHKNSKERTIYRDLFFRENDLVYPYLLADNERYLRQLVYLQDARILLQYTETGTDSVDVLVLTKDVFSIGGNLGIDSRDKGKAELKEENLMGSGSRISVSGFYEKGRDPDKGFSAEFVKRNIAGRFVDWTTGFQNYRPAFNSGRNEETYIYSRLEKPLVTAYIPSTGSLEAAFYRTSNAYVSDSLYRSDYRYEYYNLDGWFGYSLDSKRMIYANKEIRMHRFIALRVFNQRFIQLPEKYKTVFDYRYTDFTGTLASISFFRQIFYKTNFIYGFGRSEDIPEGFNLAITSGFVNRQGMNRPYSGVDFQYADFKKKGFYSNYTIRIGGYFNKNRFEDVDLLFNVEHFTRLSRLAANWYHRTFITAGITGQINPVLNSPLFLTSNYGLPYFNNGSVVADMRATIKAESVFYNTHKILGFRLAPFVFGDFSLLKPQNMSLGKSDGFSAIGGGVRTRNENLIFGTIELKGYIYPRTNPGMQSWKIELNSNIRFKYNSTLISRPDFIIAN